MNGPTVEVLYSCHACGIDKRRVEVRERKPDEDAVHWVEQVVGRALGADHAKASPRCRATTISEVRIPYTGVERIGDAVRQ